MVIQSPNDLINPLIVLTVLAVALFVVFLVLYHRRDDSRSTWVVGWISLALCVAAGVLFVVGISWHESLPKVYQCQLENDGIYHCRGVYKDSGIVIR